MKRGRPPARRWNGRSGRLGRVVFEVRTEVLEFELDSTRTSLSVEYLEDRRDDFFDPTRGLLAELAVKASSGRDFLKVSGECRWYRKIFWKSVLALRVSGGTILSRRTLVSIPSFERFFAGGSGSVRGWKLNRLGPRGPSRLAAGRAEPSGRKRRSSYPTDVGAGDGPVRGCRKRGDRPVRSLRSGSSACGSRVRIALPESHQPGAARRPPYRLSRRSVSARSTDPFQPGTGVLNVRGRPVRKPDVHVTGFGKFADSTCQTGIH